MPHYSLRKHIYSVTDSQDTKIADSGIWCSSLLSSCPLLGIEGERATEVQFLEGLWCLRNKNGLDSYQKKKKEKRKKEKGVA